MEAEHHLGDPSSTALAARPGPTDNAMSLIQARFPEEDRKAIARFLTIDDDDPALPAYLAVCAAHGLNPVMGQIWLIPQKVKARDGSPDREMLRPAVGRDGFLAIANRTPEFEGIEFDVVCANDTFEVEHGGEDGPKVVHRYRSLGPAEEGEDPRAYRGPIIGAWAKAHIRGRRPVFYFAPLKEHGKTGTNSNTGEKYWKGAWSYTSTMILKSAQSYVLRIALGVTGIVPVDELRPDAEGEAPVEGTVVEDPVEAAEEAVRAIEGIPQDLQEDLIAAAREANVAEAFSWSPAKIRMRVEGRPKEEVRKVLEEMNADARRYRERAETPKDANRIIAKEVEPGMQIWLPAPEEAQDADLRVWWTVEDAAQPDEDSVLLTISLRRPGESPENAEQEPAEFNATDGVLIRSGPLK